MLTVRKRVKGRPYVLDDPIYVLDDPEKASIHEYIEYIYYVLDILNMPADSARKEFRAS
jgi:hypothetical protein